MSHSSRSGSTGHPWYRRFAAVVVGFALATVGLVAFAGPAAAQSAAAPVLSSISPNNGTEAENARVHITGSGFTNATAVNFGTVPSTNFTVYDDGFLIATAPTVSSTQTVDITVVTPQGTSAITGADQFTYTKTVNLSGPTSPVSVGTPYQYAVTVPHASTAPGTVDLTATLSGAAATFTGGSVDTDAVDTCTPAGTQITCHADAKNVNESDGSIVYYLTVLSTADGVVTVQASTTASAPPFVGSDSITNTVTSAVPAVDEVTPDEGPLAGGATVEITGSGFTNATAVTFGTTPAAGYTVTSDSSIVAVSPAGSAVGTVDVTVTTPDGTSASGPADEFSYTYPFAFVPSATDPPTVTKVNAGQVVPVRFTLGGDRGLNVLATGFPVSQQIDCASHAPIGSADPAGSPNGLVFTGGQYGYDWTTNAGWAGTCREFDLGLVDDTIHTALFEFH